MSVLLVTRIAKLWTSQRNDSFVIKVCCYCFLSHLLFLKIFLLQISLQLNFNLATINVLLKFIQKNLTAYIKKLTRTEVNQ